MRRILVVDDKEDNLYYLQSLLKGYGYEVEAARHGAEALVKARRSRPDLVISDLLMPVMDGYTLLRHWRADCQLAPVPFIVYTATYTEAEDERLARRLGADAFILKPAEPDDFLERIREVEAGGSRQPAAAEPSRPGEAEGDLLASYSETLIRKLEEKTLELQETNRALERDMAERKRLESQLLQAQKLEAVGRLAGGVAHDFNNLLSVIMGHAELMLDHASPEQRGEIEQILEAAERGAGLTRQLLAFSRRQMVDPRVLDLNELIAGMEQMLRRLLGEDVVLTLRRLEEPAPVLADHGQLEQVLMNLCINSRDAMPRGGHLCIEIKAVQVEPGDSPDGLDGELAPGRYALLSVADSGSGIEEGLLAHVFEPFFTTKEPGKGTGLGLSTVYGIVKQAGGSIAIRSEAGRGAEFRIYLPWAEGPAEEAREKRERQPVGGAETLLLVEDEAPLREISRRILEGQGYRVLAAAEGREALDLAAAHDGAIDLLIADVVMPGMNGRALAGALRTSRPGLRVLYISGYADDFVVQQGAPDRGARLLTKPFHGDVLLQRVREALDDPAPG